jgi:exonuclease VII large subunit
MLEKAKNDRYRFTLTAQGLENMSPLKVLIRGYAIATMEGAVVRSIDEVSDGDHLNIEMIDGRLMAVIQGKEKVERWKG